MLRTCECTVDELVDGNTFVETEHSSGIRTKGCSYAYFKSRNLCLKVMPDLILKARTTPFESFGLSCFYKILNHT